MDLLVIGFLFLSTASCNFWVGHGGGTTFSVLDYGAKGDGQTDDSEAFRKAWEGLCGATASGSSLPTLIVPAGHTFFLHHELKFKGPCRSKRLHFQILGTLLAPKRNEWLVCNKHWISFTDVAGLLLDGTGVINGQGQDWWTTNALQSPHVKAGCTTHAIPSTLVFQRCDDLQISGLTHLNGPGGHIVVADSKDVTISHVNISSPLGSHNTDGIDVSHSIRVNIDNSFIGTGDDCIAIKGTSSFINISQIACGPGHGISVGSLGGHDNNDTVEEVHVRNCNFYRADSGVKIKTWPGGKGLARAITFQHITVKETRDPIFIDQHYMHNPEQPDGVKVRDIIFDDIHGTSFDDRAIVLDCGKIGCSNITLNQINITSIDPKKPASTICNYVQGTAQNTSPPVPCLSK